MWCPSLLKSDQKFSSDQPTTLWWVLLLTANTDRLSTLYSITCDISCQSRSRLVIGEVFFIPAVREQTILCFFNHQK
ncbi:uncharacterized protein PHALS_15104 [Plasmopara halstedii]|uniref:Uncharacterized protein n=1 Tax=Plasmopara halstedii TaxID=4781 RepID=A0A0P1B169_PLAHL|nr:uncharacterized protein PHALS_15104 [Plasmopara halstedii]CEG48162.1 hypothetical protein PHALS_15104 [Plasmopara halstedii]|eukprot:XP_024584531.1 hypothetical protein PHALS_15104 [Plasmopara halstedii]